MALKNKLQVKGKAIFGFFAGYDKDGKVRFYDLELHKIVKYKKEQVRWV